MDEYKLQDIWKKNLRKFNNVIRLDSIIIRAMQEAIEEAQVEQLISSSCCCEAPNPYSKLICTNCDKDYE